MIEDLKLETENYEKIQNKIKDIKRDLKRLNELLELEISAKKE